MADVTIKYKGSPIAEMNGVGNKTLKTAGTYCEGDIEVAYAPNAKSYEITLAKSSGWVLLTTLDADVLEHINDDGLVVSLTNMGGYTHEANYTRSMVFATNVSLGKQGDYLTYGTAIQNSNATTVSGQSVYHKANDTSTSDLGGGGRFRLGGSSYYVKPGDAFIRTGTYRLTFTW